MRIILDYLKEIRLEFGWRPKFIHLYLVDIETRDVYLCNGRLSIFDRYYDGYWVDIITPNGENASIGFDIISAGAEIRKGNYSVFATKTKAMKYLKTTNNMYCVKIT